MDVVSDFSFERSPEDKQLLAIPIVMRTLRIVGLDECNVGSLHPKDEEITMRLWYAGYREGDRVNSRLTYTTRYFSLYERPCILIQNPFKSPKSIVELGGRMRWA